MRRSLAAGLLGLAVGLPFVALPAGAAELAATGWWWRVQGDGPVSLPRPPFVPEGGLMVQQAPSGAMAVAAVRAADVPDGAKASLTLRVADASQGLADGLVVACAATAAWAGGDAQPWSKAPTADCSTPAPGDVAADGATVSLT